MMVYVDMSPLAKPQSPRRNSLCGGRAPTQNCVKKKSSSGTGGSPVDAYSFSFANKLTNIHDGAQDANHRYFYDLAGNLVTSIVASTTNTYAYNVQNRLADVTIRGAGDLYARYLFFYDSLHRRVRITSYTPQSDTRYILHDGTLPIAETLNNTYMRRTFVRGVGIADGTADMIAEIIGTDGGSAQAVFYLSNHRGDTLAAYRGSDTLVAKYRYDAFGNQRTDHCGVKEPEYAPRYTFSTKEYLPAAGLYLYQYRVYDPIAGRWTQRDPIDYQDSINLYQFCGNNPVNLWDADGRVIWKQFWRGMGGALAGVTLFGIGAKVAVVTSPSGVGIVAGGAVAIAGIAVVGFGLGVAAAAVADVPTGIPASIGEISARLAKGAIGSENPHVNTAIDGIGIAIDSILCPRNGSYQAIGAISTALSGSTAIDDATQRYKEDLAKRGNQSQDKPSN